MAKTKTDEPWRVVHRAADRHVPRFVGPFVASVEVLRARVSWILLEESVNRGEMLRPLVEQIDGLKIAKAADPADLATKVYSQVILATVTDLAGYVESRWGAPGATVVGRFDVVSPFVLRAAEELTANLIREVSAETKMAVRRIIFQSVRDGVAPRDAAKLIRQTLGLTTRQALAVDRLRAGLIDGGLDAAKADARAARYADRLLRDRAENVARTETMRAANRGQLELWRAMQNQGVLPMNAAHRWLTTPDDRLCARCAPLNGRMVELGYLFRETERGVLPSQRVPVAGANVVTPPLHPRCRCTTVLVDDLD